MGLKRRNPTRTRLFTPPQMLAAMASAEAPANQQVKPKPVASTPSISRAERHRMIAEAAYRHAERAGFSGDPLTDWLRAEREIDALLARKAS